MHGPPPGAGLVSVVIPIYNAERYLAASLASALAQTYPHVEILAVDDGSTDGSVERLRAHGDRVVLLQQRNGGAAAARNRGVRHARGEWIAFLDADDCWAPTKLEQQLARCGHLAWSHTDSVFAGGVNDGRRDSALTPKHAGRVLPALVCGNFIGTSSVLIRRQAFLEGGGFDESLRSIQDWDLWLRVAARHAIGYLDEPLVEYRVHAASTSRNTRRTLPCHMQVIDRAFSDGGPAAHLRRLAPLARANSLGICSQIAEEEDDYSTAFTCAAAACRQEPFARDRWRRAATSLVKMLLRPTGLLAPAPPAAMNGQVDGVVGGLDPQAVGARLAHELRAHVVNAHAHEVVLVGAGKAQSPHLADEVGPHLVNAEAHQLVGAQSAHARGRQRVDLAERHAVNAHAGVVGGGEPGVVTAPQPGNELGRDAVNA